MNDKGNADTARILMTNNDSGGTAVETTVALKTGKIGGGTGLDMDTAVASQRVKADRAHVRASADQAPGRPARPTRRPMVWVLLAAAAVVGIGGGISYYLYARLYESTDDAFVEAHVVAVSPRVAGHVDKVLVDDNQWVEQGQLLAELDPRDFQSRLAAAEAALAAAKAGQRTHSIGTDVTQITSAAGVDEASAGVDGAQAAVETARAAVVTAKSQQAEAQAALAAAKAGKKQAQADLVAAEARQQRAETFMKRIAALVPDHAASQDTLDEAVAAQQVASADVVAAKEKIASHEAAVNQGLAAIAAADSGLRQAELAVTGQQAALGRASAHQAGATVGASTGRTEPLADHRRRGRGCPCRGRGHPGEAQPRIHEDLRPFRRTGHPQERRDW